MKIIEVSEKERRKFFLEIMNDIKNKEFQLIEMKNNISEEEFNRKKEILKDAKLRARKSFLNGSRYNWKEMENDCKYKWKIKKFYKW